MKKEIASLQQTTEWEKKEVQDKYIGANGLSNQLTKELKQVEADLT